MIVNTFCPTHHMLPTKLAYLLSPAPSQKLAMQAHSHSCTNRLDSVVLLLLSKSI